MQLICEDDQTVNIGKMSVVESPPNENISNVKPSLETLQLMPVKQPTDTEIFTEKKDADKGKDSGKINGDSEIPLKGDGDTLAHKENGNNTVETECIGDKSKVDNENRAKKYDSNESFDTDEIGEHFQTSADEILNGSGKPINKQSVKEVQNDNTALKKNEIIVAGTNNRDDNPSPMQVDDPTIEEMETDLDFGDDDDADESFEIKLDYSFDELDDITSKSPRDMDDVEKGKVIAVEAEDNNDKSQSFAKIITFPLKKSENVVEETDDHVGTIKSVDEGVEKSDITTVNVLKADNETESVNSLENIAKSGVNMEQSNSEETGMNFVHSAKEYIDTEKKSDMEAVISNSVAINEKGDESMDTQKEAIDKEVVVSSARESIMKSAPGIKDAALEPLELLSDLCESAKKQNETSNKDLVASSTNEATKESTTEIRDPDIESLDEDQPMMCKTVDNENKVSNIDLVESLASEAIEESAAEIKGADIEYLDKVQPKLNESVDKKNEASNKDLVDPSASEAIKKYVSAIKDTESHDKAQPKEQSKTCNVDSFIESKENTLEANTDDKAPINIDIDASNEAVHTKEIKADVEKQKHSNTSEDPTEIRQRSSSCVEIMDVDSDEPASKNEEEVKKLVQPDASSKTKKRDTRINLDIFSDEEEDEPVLSKKPETPEDTEPKVYTPPNGQAGKEFVSLDDDDDDDIMVIDDEAASKSDKGTEKDETEEETEQSEKPQKITDKRGSDTDDVITTNSVDIGKTESPVEDEAATKKKIDRPLAASDFINNFKTKIGEMSRADLEEFCLLKIVEGVVDRSNLSEIKDKLKQMMLNVEEWRKKTLVLNKQNRDLQIVLRTVQEEQKKRSDEMITPLKITRSVGMQVLIGDGKADPLNRLRPNQKRPAPVQVPVQASPQRTPPPVKTEAKTTKPPLIPVPRLVPAQSPTKSGPSKPSPLQNATVTSNTKNGLKTVVKAAEKRSLGDTVDLTDDEPAPPAKKAPPPVRLVPSNQLLAPRAPLVNKTGSPRQVYIPIGQQANIRPGQKLSFKSPGSGPSPRARMPETPMMRAATPRAVVPRGPHKHPAPLPQAYQQPQPPNWKSLPPAPDLKISKIENGIVVSWKIDGYQEDSYEEIVSYQLYAYQETSQPASTFLWNKIGDIKALPLPMACTLTQFIAGYKYYFAVRAVDVRSRLGPFSLPGSILLLNK